MKQTCAVLAVTAILGFGALRAAADDVAVIVNKSNPQVAMTSVQLRAILLGEAKWTKGGKITVVMTPAGQPERSGILRLVCGMSETDFNLYFIHGFRNGDRSFNHGTSERPMVLGTGLLVWQYVASDPSAVGFIKASEVEQSVKVLMIDGSRPGQAAYKLKIR